MVTLTPESRVSKPQSTRRRIGNLVLHRRPGQAIVFAFGDRTVTVQFDHMRAGGAVLSIRAPRDVIVMREELLHDRSIPFQPAAITE